MEVWVMALYMEVKGMAKKSENFVISAGKMSLRTIDLGFLK